MVIDKLLKVNSTDPRAEELRQRLAALQQKGAPSPATNPEPPRAGPTQPPTGAAAQPATRPGAMTDAELQRMGFIEQKRVVETREPEVRLKEERTLALVMTQIQEVINLQSEGTKKIRDVEAKNLQLQKDLETFKDKHEELLQKMNGIDSRLEKFMGLYEIVTAQYNPFANGHGTTIAPSARPGAQTHGNPSPAPASPTTAQTQQPAAPSFTDSLKEQLARQQAAAQAKGTTPPASAGTFAVEDSLTRQKATVEVRPEDAAVADATFRKVEELLADLHRKREEEKQAGKPLVTEAPQPVVESLHTFLTGFEQRLTKQLDASLQDKIHERFSKLESNLQSQIRDALHDEIEAVQRDEEALRHELMELQSLVQAKEGPARDSIEDELAELQRKLGAMRDDIGALSPELYFRVVDGTVLKNLADLRDALKTMRPETFAHHVRPGANDFASWVEHALASPTLADLLRQQTTPGDMVKTIVAHDGLSD